MQKKTCFFIGHREAPDSILPTLIDEVERHITGYGVNSFVVGHYGQFDALAGQAVIEAKKRHPGVSLFMLLPYQTYGRSATPPEGFDNTFYPFGTERVPKRAAIPKANQYMVDHSDFLIAYVWHAASNSRKILEAALKRQERGLMRVTNLAQQGTEDFCGPNYI
ncbi:hypothetical protein [Pseudoflavonifractor phocaeensis]|uniref:hypothetical protein n=1 Tax=Pseudoflavonifractor phocaeensis TaxID=1870988 RepID=UPI00195CE276|nr:hypothetical protein [Pseudoflavonifractor phocaeensis]MBM6721560.1 hypothetical protein [Pseudoflavonifractor phocaeensis]